MASAACLVIVRNRAARVLILGAVGFSVTGVFYFYAAPDLALTQLSVEIVSLVLFLLVLNLLPDESPRDRTIVVPRVLIAALVGGAAGGATLLASGGERPERAATLATGERPESLGEYFLRNSYAGRDTAAVPATAVGTGVVDRGAAHLDSFGSTVSKYAGGSYDVAETDAPAALATETLAVHKGGGGANVVNVILVDFRSFDTLGEVGVLGLAALGVWTLLRKPPGPGDAAATDNRSEPHADTFETDAHAPAAAAELRSPRPTSSQAIASPILQTAARLLVPLAVVFALYLFAKGHQSPGGGFVGGLATAVALIVYRMCFGCDALYRLLPVRERTLIGVGLLLATLTAAAPLLLGLPLLTSNNGYLPLPGGGYYHWSTVLIFDLGVYLIVIGSVVGMIDALARELE